VAGSSANGFKEFSRFPRPVSVRLGYGWSLASYGARLITSQRMRLEEFAAKYPGEGPHIPCANADQERLLGEADGVVLLSTSPFPEPVSGVPGEADGRHLWVIRETSLPVILETAPRVQPPPLASGVAKHTNLTGGQPACCGGELWVDAVAADRLYVNGGSARYWRRPHLSGPAKLADGVSVFETLGYTVISAGWDEDNDVPARTFRET
jgi:hypothetical protein